MLRKLLLSILAILAVTVLLFGTVLGLAQTRLAKAQISGMVEDSLTGDGQTAEVDQLEGFLPFDVRLGRFRLADDTGTWLEVDNARVKVSPTRLLAGEILVEEAGAERVAVHRTPVLPAQPEPPPSDEPFSLPAPPALPESLPRATLERLYVDRIELGEALIGEDAVFTLEGNATTGPEGRNAQARLDVTRIDQATAALGLGASLDLAAKTIGLELDATETGGLMATLTGQSDAGNLDLSLTGDGPLDAWQAELSLAIERLVTANADLALAYAENPSLDLSLDVVPEPGALPEDIAAALGERLELELAAGQRAPGQFGLDRLSLQSGIVTASGRIEARLDQDRLEGRVEVVAEDLARASGLAGQPLGGRVTLGLDAAGTFTEPRFQLSLDGSGISAGDLGLDTLSLALAADLLGPLNEPFAGAAVEGTGSITGLTQAGEPLRPENSLTLDLAATVPMQGEARVERLRLAGQHVSLSGTADLTMPELAGTARLDAQVPSIEALLAALGPNAPPDLAATGAVELGADITLAAALEQFGVDFELQGQGLGGLPDQLDQLIGASPSVTSTVTLRPGESVLVDALDVSTAALQLQGDLALGLDETQSLSGQLQLSPFNLQTIEGLVGQPIGGVVTTSVQLGGTLPEPGLDADLRIDNLLVAERSFDRVSLAANAGQASGTYGGTVALGVEQTGELVQLKSDFSLDQPRLTLANLALSGPSTELTGGAEINLESLLATGELGGGIGDLAALQPWTGQALRGSVDLDASFDATGGTQDARLALFVDDLGGDFGTLRRAEIEADLTDVMGRLGVDATVTASVFAQPEPGFALADARVSVTGDRELYAIEATAQGEMNGPFNVNAAARADVLSDARAVYLDALDGIFQAQTIKLMSPAVLQLESGVLDIDQLDLRIGDASIQGNLNLDQGRNRAKAGLVIETLPMAMLAEFGAPPMQGELTGQVTLDGPVTAPVIDGTVTIADLVMMQGKERLGGPANVAIDIALADTEFVTNARVDGLGDGPITLNFQLPMQLSLQPFVLDLPETLPLDGKVTAKSRLEPLVALAALDGQTVEGDLTLDLRIEGTVARPQVTGKLDIANGRIADALSGIILRDLTVALVGQGDRLVIERFTASDTAQGRLTLEGNVGIDPDQAFPYTLDLKTTDLRVLDSDLGRATVTADLKAEGTTDKGKTSGRITVPRADLRLPSGGAVQPVTLDVEVRGAPPPAQPATSGTTSGPSTMALDIDIDMPARIFVRGRGLDTEWGGSLDVTGTAREPRIEGTISYRRGFLDFLDRRFDIRTGRVTFTGGSPPIPDIDLEAAAQGGSITAIIRLAGPATQPEFAMSSEPELPQDEVLSRLLFDRETSGLTPVQGVRLAAALATLEGDGIDAMGKLRDAVGLDVLDLGNADFGDDDPQTTATAGQYVADNVFIAVDQGLTTGGTRGRVEVELTPNITVRGDVDDQSRSGVGLDWSFDY